MLDLERLRTKLDTMLNSETNESYRQWYIENKRKNNMNGDTLYDIMVQLSPRCWLMIMIIIIEVTFLIALI